MRVAHYSPHRFPRIARFMDHVLRPVSVTFDTIDRGIEEWFRKQRRILCPDFGYRAMFFSTLFCMKRSPPESNASSL